MAWLLWIFLAKLRIHWSWWTKVIKANTMANCKQFHQIWFETYTVVFILEKIIEFMYQIHLATWLNFVYRWLNFTWLKTTFIGLQTNKSFQFNGLFVSLMTNIINTQRVRRAIVRVHTHCNRIGNHEEAVAQNTTVSYGKCRLCALIHGRTFSITHFSSKVFCYQWSQSNLKLLSWIFFPSLKVLHFLLICSNLKFNLYF